MPDLDQLVYHVAVGEALIELEQEHGPFLESQTYEVRRIIAAAVAKVLEERDAAEALLVKDWRRQSIEALNPGWRNAMNECARSLAALQPPTAEVPHG